jgi:CDP-paratose 2-epimerase
MRYLVTGGAGCIGSTIVRNLLNLNHAVSVIDSAEEERNRWIVRQFKYPIDLHVARLEEMGDRLPAILDGVDAVIHCAASTGIPWSVENPASDWRSNVDATRVLLEALRLHPLPTVVFSSVKPYYVPDDIEARGGLREEDPLIPDEAYAASKASQSMLAMSYARSYGVPAVTFRCSNLFSDAPSHGPRHNWGVWFAISAAIGRPLTVQGNGLQTRDMLFGSDIFSACMLAIEHAQRLRGRVFNLGGGASNRISIIEAATMLAQLGGVEIKSAPARAMDDLHVFVHGGAWLKETGWRPQTEVRDGLRQVFEWAKANSDELRKLYEGA